MLSFITKSPVFASRFALLLFACASLGACEKGAKRDAEAAPTTTSAVGTLVSNASPEDYVGPTSCAECHKERYEQWSTNLHRRMNRSVDEEGAVLAPFAGEILEIGGDERVRFSRQGDELLFMSFERQGRQVRRYRITRTIGSRYLQEYVGRQVEGPEPAGDPIYERELRLPYGYLIGVGEWFHQQYFDSWHDEEFDESGARRADPLSTDSSPWRGRCAWCHNTYPFSFRMARLREEQSIGSGIELLYQERGAPPLADDSLLLDTEQLVTVGISCESCHFGGRAHVEEGHPMHFSPRAPYLEERPGAPRVAGTREDPATINSICAQCHSVPTPLYPNGAGSRNSSEALDLLSGACKSRIKCTDCHDPHVPGPGADAPDLPERIAACTGCHQALADEDVALEHSRHEASVTCLDCHMPKIVQGLDSFIRSHRISAPGDERMLPSAPNACNLCHLDQSVAWTARELREEWGMEIEGSYSEEPAWSHWIEGEDRATRLAAMGAMARSKKAAYLPRLLKQLEDPVAHDRLRALFAVEGILGRKLRPREFDLRAAPARRKEQVRALLGELKKNTLSKPPL